MKKCERDDAIVRGTTPTIIIDLDDVPLEHIRDYYVTFAQDDKIVLTKRRADCGERGQAIEVPLSSEDTLRLNKGVDVVQIQLICKFGGDQTVKCVPVSMMVYDALDTLEEA